jgi:peptide subunit release factor 1 (eRF1)
MAVQSALTHAINIWKHISPKEYPNGAVAFCSEDLTEVLHPPTPLRRRIYDCGRLFNTAVIQDALDAQLGNVYGLIVVDGSDAAFGKVQGLGLSAGSPVITELGHIGSHIAGRTRRGGQSANRYGRFRDESELAYVRKVAERAAMLFEDTDGLILAGKADVKHKLSAELPDRMQKQILCTLDLSCEAGPGALRRAALYAASSANSAEQLGLEQTLKSFYDLTMKESNSMCCYGKVQTLRALELGAVERLLLSADQDTSLTLDEWFAMAASHGSQVVQIQPKSELTTQFCKSFGIGGFLRWPVDAGLLDGIEETGNKEGSNVKEECTEKPNMSMSSYLEVPRNTSLKKADMNASETPAGTTADVDDVSVSTIDTADITGAEDVSQHRRCTLAWFEAKLEEVLGDPCSAQTLAACVEVVLSDEVSSRDDIIEGVHVVAASEGIPDELVAELIHRW